MDDGSIVPATPSPKKYDPLALGRVAAVTRRLSRLYGSLSSKNEPATGHVDLESRNEIPEEEVRSFLSAHSEILTSSTPFASKGLPSPSHSSPLNISSRRSSAFVTALSTPVSLSASSSSAALSVQRQIPGSPLSVRKQGVQTPAAAPAAVVSTPIKTPKKALRKQLRGWQVLRVVESEGAVVSEELVSFHKSEPLFTLQDAADLAKNDNIVAARVVFNLLLIGQKGYIHRERELAVNMRKSAIYWVTRARFEENAGNFDSVVHLYELAEQFKASPKVLLSEGLRWFLIRMKDNTKSRASSAVKGPETASAVVVESPIPVSSTITTALTAMAASSDTTSTPQIIGEKKSDLQEVLRDIQIEDIVSPLTTNYDKTPVVSPLKDIKLCLTQTTLKELEKDQERSLDESFEQFEDARDTLYSGPSTPAGKTPQTGGKSRSVSKFRIENTPQTGPRRRKTLQVADAITVGEGSTVKYAQITPSKKMREMLGTDLVITPVRRSARKAPHPAMLVEKTLTVDNISEISNPEFAFVPNHALRDAKVGKQRMTAQTPQPRKGGEAFNVERLVQTAAKQRKTNLKSITIEDSDDEAEADE